MDFPQPRFTRMLMHTNQPVLDDFDSWVFHPGMMFDSAHKWWRDFGTRDFPHEGIDLCLFLDRSMRTRCLRPETRVPAMFAGVVRAMFKDYLDRITLLDPRDLLDADYHVLGMGSKLEPQSRAHSSSLT